MFIRTLTAVAAAAMLALPVQLAGVRPLASLTSDDFADLEFLRERLKDVRVVQIGEAGHGVAEQNHLKARLVRFLHQELGFGVLAFESSLYLAHRADQRAAVADPQATLTSSLIGVWHTKEVLPLFEYLKASRATTRPLRLAGFDIQPIGSGKNTRPAFLREIVASRDTTYADAVATLDTTFLAEYDKGGSSRRAYFSSHREELVNGYSRLAAFLAGPAGQPRSEASRVAMQEARSMTAYVRQQTAPDNKGYAESRDEGMADNVRFLTDELFPDQKVIVWAHNYHVAHSMFDAESVAEVFPGVPARSMGSWTRVRLGERVYTIGVYPYEGRAVDNGRTEFAIEAPQAGSLEQRLGEGAASPAVFVDIKSALAAGLTWLRSPVSARFEGRSAQKLVPASQYDAVIVIRRVSPPVFLY